MLGETLRWLTLGCGGAGFVLLVWAWWGRARGERRLCPGHAPGWRGWLDPRRLVLRDRCGYDLSGVPRDGGVVRCPECGRSRAEGALLRPGRRVRIGVIGAALVGLFWVGFGVPWNQRGRWAAGLPTLVLAAMDQPGTDRLRKGVRVELDERVLGGEVKGLHASVLAWRVAGDLRADEHHRNAERAEHMLDTLWPHSRPALEALLSGDDVQGRVLAAAILRARCLGDPSDALLDACIADIGQRPEGLGWYLRLRKCSDAAEFLLLHAQAAQEKLVAAMRDEDPHRRLVAAAVIAWAGLAGHEAEVAGVLLPHLESNDLGGDAIVAAPALYQLGPAIAPLLRERAGALDAQGRATALAIADRLEHPDVPVERLEHRMPRLTGERLDPLDVRSLGETVRGLWF